LTDSDPIGHDTELEFRDTSVVGDERYREPEGETEKRHRMDYHLTEHARDALEKRRIQLEWLEKAPSTPEWTEKDMIDGKLERRRAL